MCRSFKLFRSFIRYFIIISLVLLNPFCFTLSLAQEQDNQGYQNIIQNDFSNTNTDFFTLDSSKETVQKIMGKPSFTDSYSEKEIWYYKLSSVTFKDGKVYEWNNTSENLKVCLGKIDLKAQPIQKGDVKDRVCSVMGTPKRIFNFPTFNTEIWHYNQSCITFRHGLVYDWNNASGELKVINRPDFLFKIGDNENQVRKSMGNPSTIYCNPNKYEDLWYYEPNSLCIYFKNKKVSKFEYPVIKIDTQSTKSSKSQTKDINTTLKEFYGTGVSRSRIDNIYTYRPGVAENGSYYGEISDITGRAKTVHVDGYYRKDGTYVQGHYRSKPSR